jgi:hypothetical protein
LEHQWAFIVVIVSNEGIKYLLQWCDLQDGNQPEAKPVWIGDRWAIAQS